MISLLNRECFTTFDDMYGNCLKLRILPVKLFCELGVGRRNKPGKGDSRVPLPTCYYKLSRHVSLSSWRPPKKIVR